VYVIGNVAYNHIKKYNMRTTLNLLTFFCAILFSITISFAQTSIDLCIAVAKSPQPAAFMYHYDINSWSLVTNWIDVQNPEDIVYDSGNDYLWLADGNQLYIMDPWNGVVVPDPNGFMRYID